MKVPMDEFLAHHDLVYEKLPSRWLDGIPLGNGRMGVVVWGDDNSLKMTLDRNDVWQLPPGGPDYSEYNYGHLRELVSKKSQEEILEQFWHKPARQLPTCRLPLPRLTFDFGEPVKGFDARLVLHDAVARGKIEFAKGSVEWSAFVHAERDVFVIDMVSRGTTGPLEVSICKHLDQEAKDKLASWGHAEPVIESSSSLITYWQEVPHSGSYGIALKRIRKGSRETVFLSVASSMDSPKPLDRARDVVEEAAADFDTSLLAEHAHCWHGFWDKSFLSVPDSKVENLFYLELYKMNCNMRERGLSCSLQGVWTTDGSIPGWSGEYALNMNIQEAYWPVYASNHLEAGASLYEQFWKLLPVFQEQCRSFFGFEGAHTPGGIALNGTPVYGYPTVNFWPGNGAWVSHLYWLHWLYSKDRKFLKERAYPFMREFMQTYLNLLEKGDDGKYHLPLSHSPEFREADLDAWGRDTTGDLFLIRWIASALLESLEILGAEDEDAVHWKDVLDNLVEPPQDRHGLCVFVGQPLSETHRHHTHLIGIHPLGLLNIEGSQEDKDLIERSLYNLEWKGTGAWSGWSFPWMSLIASRTGHANMAWQMLQDYFHFISPNTFHTNGDPRKFGVSLQTYEPMTLEAGFCFAAAVLEMLLQSWGGVIRVFPAMAEFWHDGYFEGLRAEGAFLVTARRRKGQAVFVEIRSETDAVCRVANPFKGDVELIAVGSRKRLVLSGKVVAFETKPGESYRLCAAGKNLTEDDLAPTVCCRNENESNWFGLKHLPLF